MRHLAQLCKPPVPAQGDPAPRPGLPAGCPGTPLLGTATPGRARWQLRPPPTSPPWHAAPRSPPGLGTARWHGSRHRQAARGRAAACQRCALALLTPAVPSRLWGPVWGTAGGGAGRCPPVLCHLGVRERRARVLGQGAGLEGSAASLQLCADEWGHEPRWWLCHPTVVVGCWGLPRPRGARLHVAEVSSWAHHKHLQHPWPQGGWGRLPGAAATPTPRGAPSSQPVAQGQGAELQRLPCPWEHTGDLLLLLAVLGGGHVPHECMHTGVSGSPLSASLPPRLALPPCLPRCPHSSCATGIPCLVSVSPGCARAGRTRGANSITALGAHGVCSALRPPPAPPGHGAPATGDSGAGDRVPAQPCQPHGVRAQCWHPSQPCPVP